MKVKTPQPRLKRRYAPKEMRAQNGSFFVVSQALVGACGTYIRNDLFLELLGQGNDLQEQGEVYLLHVRIQFTMLKV